MLKEDAVPAANGSLAIAERILGETDARSGVEKVSAGAPYWNATDTALHQPVERITHCLEPVHQH